MPTYDYLCPNGHRFEVVHGVTADGPESCAVCGASPVRKAFSAPSIHFKGSGWAKKDRTSSSSGSTRAAAADGSAAGKDAAGAVGGSAAKADEGAKAPGEKSAGKTAADTSSTSSGASSSSSSGSTAAD